MNRLISRLALIAGIAAALLIGGAGPLYRYAGFDLGQAFGFMTWGVYVAGGALALSVIWVILAAIGRSGEGLVAVVLAVILAVGSAQAPVRMQATAASLPFIHDVTTDTASPPAFVAIAPMRADAPNGVDYATDPAEQAKGYPDIKTLNSPLPPAELFEKALAAAQSLKWNVVSSSREEGRIEATDETLWWGFKDDVVIRIQAEGAGSKLDIRSMSRVGKSDIGKNAERIRAFLAIVSN
jgi:uncharacterized protein (DUF1499 family)